MRLLLFDPDAETRACVAQAAERGGHELSVAGAEIDVASLRSGDVDCAILTSRSLPSEADTRHTIGLLADRGIGVLVIVDDAEQALSCCLDPHGNMHEFEPRPLDVARLVARLQLVRTQRRERKREQAILAALPDLVFHMTAEGDYLDVHAADESNLYVPLDQIIGKNVADLLPPHLVARMLELVRRAADSGEPQLLEYDLEVPSGSSHFETRVVRCAPGEVIAVVRDISEQKRLLSELQLRQSCAASFASKTVEVLESERQNIAQELHDMIGQMLLVHRMDVEWIAKHADGAARAAARALSGALDETLQAVRSLALGLRPPILDDLGIGSALEELTRDITRRSGIACECVVDPMISDLRRDVALTLYRVAQEALSNAVRHARCGRIEVRLERHDNAVELRVEDDGIGVEPGVLDKVWGRSLGMLGIQERAGLVGGAARIAPKEPSGTVISVTIPQPEKPDRETDADSISHC